MTHSTAGPSRLPGRLPLAVGLCLLAVVLVRNAWMCDDAYITFRVVDNFVSGFGLRWNVAERVQGYTHPLWMLISGAAYACTREIYYTGIVVSIGLSVLGAAFLARLARDRSTALLGLAALGLSKPWVDYSVSGLENPFPTSFSPPSCSSTSARGDRNKRRRQRVRSGSPSSERRSC